MPGGAVTLAMPRKRANHSCLSPGSACRVPREDKLSGLLWDSSALYLYHPVLHIAFFYRYLLPCIQVVGRIALHPRVAPNLSQVLFSPPGL